MLQIHVRLTQQVNLPQAFPGHLVCQWLTSLKVRSLQTLCFRQADRPAMKWSTLHWSHKMSRHLMIRQISSAITQRKDSREMQTVSVRLIIRLCFVFQNKFILTKTCLCLILQTTDGGLYSICLRFGRELNKLYYYVMVVNDGHSHCQHNNRNNNCLLEWQNCDSIMLLRSASVRLLNNAIRWKMVTVVIFVSVMSQLSFALSSMLSHWSCVSDVSKMMSMDTDSLLKLCLKNSTTYSNATNQSRDLVVSPQTSTSQPSLPLYRSTDISNNLSLLTSGQSLKSTTASAFCETDPESPPSASCQAESSPPASRRFGQLPSPSNQNPHFADDSRDLLLQ